MSSATDTKQRELTGSEAWLQALKVHPQGHTTTSKAAPLPRKVPPTWDQMFKYLSLSGDISLTNHHTVRDDFNPYQGNKLFIHVVLFSACSDFVNPTPPQGSWEELVVKYCLEYNKSHGLWYKDL